MPAGLRPVEPMDDDGRLAVRLEARPEDTLRSGDINQAALSGGTVSLRNRTYCVRLLVHSKEGHIRRQGGPWPPES